MLLQAANNSFSATVNRVCLFEQLLTSAQTRAQDLAFPTRS